MPRLEDQAVRPHGPGDLVGFGPAQVADPHGAVVPHRRGDRGQVRDVLGVVVPRRSVQVESFGDASGTVAQFHGERRQQLELCRGHDGAEPEVGGRPGDPGQEQRLGLSGGQPRQPGAETAQQPVSAVVPGLAVQRHSRRR